MEHNNVKGIDDTMPVTSNTDELFVPPAELQEAWEAHPGIVKLGDPVLRQVAAPIKQINGDTRRLIERMTRELREAHGIGLAAPQVGASARIIIYDAGEGLRVLINPRILSAHGEQLEPAEGCLSIPGLRGQVKRAMEIRVKAFDARNRPISMRAKELEARVIQHEIDHLDGILFIDRAELSTLAWSDIDNADSDNSDSDGLEE